MKCKNCGKEFFSFFSDTCPFCNTDNSVSFSDIMDTLMAPMPNNTREKKKTHDPYDWNDPNNCSEREYNDDDDYDDFDHT